MNNSTSDLATRLFSFSGLVAFLVGLALGYIYAKVQCEWWNRKHPDQKPRKVEFKSLIILWAMIFIFLAYVGVQQHKTQNNLTKLASDVADCNKEFQTISKARQVAGDETDAWSNVKTKAMGDWLRELLFPPVEMADRRVNDPKDPIYQQWALNTTDKYYKVIDQAERAQEVALQYRKDHPLPEPLCGK